MSPTTLLEIGNSTIKVAHVDAGGAIAIERYSNLEALLRRCELADGEIVCAPVGQPLGDEVVARLEEVRTVRVIDRAAFRDFIGESYDTPGTLGLDRILNLAGMEGDGVAISCGTAITVDAIASGRPSWGAIMPGFRTAAEGLHARVPALPLVPLDAEPGLPARSSMGSVTNGVLLGTAFAAAGLARLLAYDLFKGAPPRIVITGGDALLLQRLWSEREVVVVDDALLFRGMIAARSNA
jgi:pantothenate kinase type III